MNLLLILIGKLVLFFSKTINLGSGSTWPGHIALEINPMFIKQVLKQNPYLKVVIVAGTNGKTTTSALITRILRENGLRVFQNESGANLLNGLASSIIASSDFSGKLNFDTAIFEVDENNVGPSLKEINPHAILLLNIFRDQLDRYGEVNTIAKKWIEAIKGLSKTTLLIANGDDPMLRFIGENSTLRSFYFGLPEKQMDKKVAPHDVDFLYCPQCHAKLVFTKRSYSHMGIYKCPKCDFIHKKTNTFGNLPNPLFGNYNMYNINAAALLVQKGFGINPKTYENVVKKFVPAFGRQEKIMYNGKNIFLLLSKNPTSFNQSIRVILEHDKTPNVLLLLNDKIPDGRDISWIWDVEFEELISARNVTIAGDRAYDMGLRIKYCSETQNSKFKTQNFNSKVKIFENPKEALNFATSKLENSETLYILATYSAILDVRKILTGKKIL